jgi:hypothetical protein
VLVRQLGRDQVLRSRGSFRSRRVERRVHRSVGF